MIKYRAKIEQYRPFLHKYEDAWVYSDVGNDDELVKLGHFFNRIAVYKKDGLLLVPPQMWIEEASCYVGDILKCPVTEDSADYLQLEAGDKGYIIRVASIPETYFASLPDDFEILGNETDNPELIGGEK